MATLPQVSINTDLSEGLCFGCGQNNPIGLKLNFRRDGKAVIGEFTPGKLYQGWPGFVHGGIITCLLDEAMSYAVHFEGISCITAKMEIKLKRLALIEESLVITSAVTRNSRRLIGTKAKVSLRDGTVVAESTATHFVLETHSTNTVNQERESQSNDRE